MKRIFWNRYSIFVIAGFAWWGLSVWPAQAQWGSVHGNNRSAAISHAPVRTEQHVEPARVAPRVAPAPAREHEAEAHREHEVISRGHVELPHVSHEAEIERGREFERRDHDVRRWDIHEDGHHAYWWWGFHPGFSVSILPQGYIQVPVGGVPYYYYEGTYYETAPSGGYVVAAPPIGGIVPELPPGYETIVAGGTVYYYAGGAYYVQQPQGFLVVAPPLGVTVSTLPQGAVPTVINGMQYYQFGSIYYLPVMQGGVTVYTTVRL